MESDEDFSRSNTPFSSSDAELDGSNTICAVMLGLMLVESTSVWQRLKNFAAQMLDSVCGAVVLTLFQPEDETRSQGLVSNGVGEG